MEEQKGMELINSYLKKFGDLQGVKFRPLDKMGYTFVKKGSATVGINVLEKQNILIILSHIMEIPEANQLELYRKILELNFLETVDGAFAIDGKSNKLFLRAIRRLSGLDYEEFIDILDTVAKVADYWDDELIKEFGGKK